MEQKENIPASQVGRKAMSLLYLLFGLCLVSNCMAANIVTLPMFGGSHYMVIAKLGTELVNRGHKVRYSIVSIIWTHCCNPSLYLSCFTDLPNTSSLFPAHSLSANYYGDILISHRAQRKTNWLDQIIRLPWLQRKLHVKHFKFSDVQLDV